MVKILCYTVKNERGMAVEELLDKLRRDRWLTTREYTQLLQEPLIVKARRMADRERRGRFGTRVYLRGLIDMGSICIHDCAACHQRYSADHTRYRMRPREILDCCEDAWNLGFRSFYLRSGADLFYTDKMLCSLLGQIREHFPGCALGLALGERSRESLRMLSDAGADRYVLLHETADPDRFRRTHPAQLEYEGRLHCLNVLKETGFQTVCGFLVGQESAEALAKELKFLEEFQPHGVELLPMGAEPERIEYLISLIRLMLPDAWITAPDNAPGQILAGANVVTRSLIRSRRSHPICGGCRADGPADPENLAALHRELAEIGFEIDLSLPPWLGSAQ